MFASDWLYVTSNGNPLPGMIVVPLGGEVMLIVCAKHVVAKAASSAATVNFIVVTIRETLSFKLSTQALIYYKKLDIYIESRPWNRW